MGGGLSFLGLRAAMCVVFFWALCASSQVLFGTSASSISNLVFCQLVPLFFDARSFKPTSSSSCSPHPTCAIIVDGLYGLFIRHMLPACENPTVVVVPICLYVLQPLELYVTPWFGCLHRIDFLLTLSVHLVLTESLTHTWWNFAQLSVR